MKDDEEIVRKVKFFQTARGIEPVRVWLKSLAAEDRKAIGKALNYQPGWPPLVPKFTADNWELRCEISFGFARVLFTVLNGKMVIFAWFLEKISKTPLQELFTGRN